MDENNGRHEASASIIENRRIIMDENYKQPERSASASNFEVREDGLFGDRRRGDGENRICDPIWHLGNAVRADGSGASDVLKFLDRQGVRQEVIILHAEAVNHPGRCLTR